MPAWSADSLLLKQDGYSITRKSAASGDWILVAADEVRGTSVEIHEEGANIRAFTASVRGIPFSIFGGEGNPKMMPWPNRTRDGRFTDVDGISRNLFVKDSQGKNLTVDDGNGNALHGMVRSRKWEIDGFGVDSEGVFLRCVFDTKGTQAIEAIFGAFRDYSVYRLRGNRLLIDAYTENMGDSPFRNCGWGWHPWINAPAIPRQGAQKGRKDRCSLLMPGRSIALTGSDLIPTGEIRPVASHEAGRYDFTALRSVGRSDIDHQYTDLVVQPGLGFSRSVLIDYGNSVRVQFMAQHPFYPWMVLYIPGSNVVCIEHQTQEVNGLNTKKSLIAIPARSRSPTGRIWVEVDGDTSLAFTPPASIRPGLHATLAPPDRAGAGLEWMGSWVVRAKEPGSGSGRIGIYDLRGFFLGTPRRTETRP